jgi:Mrp family chromosome partitioning ATPase
VFADAESFARLADEIVYVCRFGSANRPHARQVLERLDKTDAVVLGVVLNAMPARRQAEAYYYKYGYSGAKYQKEYTSSDSKGSKG